MDPRIAKTHAAVMATATELLVEGGPQALTIDGVVARCGVAKSTVYRHWKTRDDLVSDVLDNCAPDLQMPDASLSGDDALRDMSRQFARSMADPNWRRLLPSLLVLKAQHESVADIEDAMSDQQMDIGTALLRRCVEDGSLDPSVLDDPALSITLLAGPLLLAGLFDTVEVSDSLADRVADQFLVAHRPPRR